MKWVFLLLLLMMTPALASDFRRHPRHLLAAAFMIGLLPFVMSPLHLYVAPVSWPAWPGSVKGIEISLLDALAVAIIVATRPIKTPMMFKVALGVVVTALIISTLAAAQIWPSAFYGWQLLRAVLVYLAVARASAQHSAFPIRVLLGMGLGLAIEAITAAMQYAGGTAQAGGNFGHQNLLGMASMFVALPAFALLLAGQRTALVIGLLGCEAVIVFAGGSRAAIGLFGIGLVVCMVLSVWHRSSGRKAVISAVAFLALAAAAPVMMLAIERRSDERRAASIDERGRFIDAAQMIIADHPLGVGANNYVIVANLGGYSDRAGVPWNTSERAAPVHNFYYLFAAELGLLGFVGLVMLLAAIIVSGLRALKRVEWSERSELLVGVTAAAIVSSAHFAFEWVAMTFYIHYLLAINTGLLVALGAAQKRIAPWQQPKPHQWEKASVEQPV